MTNQNEVLKKSRVTRYSCMLVKEETHLYTTPKKLDTPSSVASYVREVFNLDKRTEEHMLVIFLNAKMHEMGYTEVSHGSLTASIAHPREIYKAAVIANAHSIIAVHNHPSGNSSESTEDIQITKRLKQAGEILGIPLVDHIIVTQDAWRSLKEEGYL